MELENPQHESYCQHVALGLPLVEAARKAGYAEGGAYNSGSRLAQKPRIAQRIEELGALKIDQLPHTLGIGIRSVNARIISLQDLWERVRLVVAERSNDPDIADLPGAKSGLLIVTKRTTRIKDTETTTIETKVDHQTIAALLDIQDRAAEELGQRTARKELVSKTLNVSLQNPSEVHKLLTEHFGAIPAGERRKLLELEPSLAEFVDQPAAKSEDAACT